MPVGWGIGGVRMLMLFKGLVADVVVVAAVAMVIIYSIIDAICLNVIYLKRSQSFIYYELVVVRV